MSFGVLEQQPPALEGARKLSGVGPALQAFPPRFNRERR